MATFVNPFGNATASANKAPSGAGASATPKFINPFAGYTPPKPVSTPTPSPLGSAGVSPNPQQPPNFAQQAGNLFNQAKNVVGQVAKQVVDFIPKAPSYVAAAATHPGDTLASVGYQAIQDFGSLAGLVEHGIASAAKVNVPERWDVSKQVHALKQVNDQVLQKQGVETQKAFATGQFIGTFLPYALGAEAAELTVGNKLLLPTAERFLPGAVKFIPAINNAIGFLGVGQITHDQDNGSRVDQFKNDLIMLSMFELGGIAAKGLSTSTRGVVSKVLNEVRGKAKIDLETELPKIEQAKQVLKTDLGKPPEAYVAEQMASGKTPKLDNNLNLSATIDHGPKAQDTSNSQSQVYKEGNNGQHQNGLPNAEDKAGQSSTSQFQGNRQGFETPIGEGPLKTSSLASSVEQTAVEKKLVSELGDLPQYKQMNMKEQAQKAIELIRSDPQTALKIATGQAKPPEGLLAESVFKAVENGITTPELAKALAQSPLVSEATALGQRIKALDVKTTDSPVEAIKQVIDARKEAIKAKTGKALKEATKQVVEELETRIKPPNKYDWASFVDSIKC